MAIKEKQFISSCSLSDFGEARVTKHCGLIDRPLVAEVYLEKCASIDKHNHNIRSRRRRKNNRNLINNRIRRSNPGRLPG